MTDERDTTTADLDSEIVDYVRTVRRRVHVDEIAHHFGIPVSEADQRMNDLWDCGRLEKEDE